MPAFTRRNARARTIRRSVATAILLAAIPAGLATASDVGDAVADRVEIETYRHYLEDLLYTHLGDNRGFGPEHDLARANIRGVLSNFGLTVEFEPFQYNGTTYYNVVATQPGIDHPEQIVVVGAHFDSVNNPGADDNGTGTALVMEVARVLAPLRSARTIKYVLFDREEQGLRGSAAFVDAHAGESILMAVTADMIGHDSGFYGMDIYGKTTSAEIVNGMASAIDEYGDALAPSVNLGDYAFSDHWSFESAGIPSCVIIERCYQCNEYYHTPDDAVDIDPDYITYPMIADLLRSVVGYLVDEIDVTFHGDATRDGRVDVDDLVEIVLTWGPCPPAPESCPADLDGNGQVDVDDLVEVLLNWQ
ncbi:MAG: M28 family peptidase [Planctomycetota bacterium]|jgi:hypothetical protein